MSTIKLKLFKPFLLLLTVFTSVFTTNANEILNLKCEHLVNPIGIDNPNPRLSWMMDDNRKGAIQLAYRIIVGTDSLQLKSKMNVQWDTEKVNSGNSLITYKGRALAPFTKYFWRVEVLDKDNKLVLSKISSFETGMMGAENWK